MVKFKEKPNTKEEILRILHPLVRKWFFTKFKEFSLPQLYGVMEIHSRNNILVSAPTGATKTLTGFLSILNELIDSSEKEILEDKIYCVYISPLKALNEDIDYIKSYGVEIKTGTKIGENITIDDLRKEYFKDKLRVFVLNVDTDESIVQVLKKTYNITETPSIVIRESTYIGLMEREKLSEIIYNSLS